jgi:tetratricopeptide (TPR) repeat protein
MSLYDYFTGQQKWTDYVNNRDLGKRFEKSLTKTGDRLAVQLSRGEQDTAVAEGLGSLENRLASGVDDLRYELQDVSAGIDGLRADFHILMGDVAWKLEIQTSVLNNLLRALQAPLDIASKELRARAEDAYRNGWYEEALADFLQSEQKNYQDFAVHRSIGNIYLYHLVDLSKAVDYFQKASKYARPRDTRQAAEAEFFAGVGFGLLQNYESAVNHMREATTLNPNFYDAYYMCASFAGLLGYAHAAVEGAERAIEGDARYYERCARDHCFDKVRTEINRLLPRLLTTQEGEANSRLADLQQTIQRLRQMGVADDVLRNCSARFQEIEGVRRQGHYVALRTASSRASEAVGACLRDGVASLEEAVKETKTEIARLRSQIIRDAEQIERQAASVRREKENSTAGRGVGFLIVGTLCLVASLPNLPSVFSQFGLLIGGAIVVSGIRYLMRDGQLNSKIESLTSRASRARDRLQPGHDESIRQQEARIAAAERDRETLSKMLADLQSRRPSLMLGAAN